MNRGTANISFTALLDNVRELVRQGRHVAALQAIDHAVAEWPQERDKLLLLRIDTARVAQDTNAVAAGVSELSAFALATLAAVPKCLSSLRLRGMLHEALQLLIRCMPTPALAIEADHLGLALLRANQHESARTCYEFALACTPDFVEAHLHLGGLFLSAREFLRALPHFERAARGNPTLSDAWLGLGQCCLQTGRGAEALAAFDQVSGTIATSPLMTAWRATANAHMGDDDRALALYDGALARDAQCFDALFGLALIQERRGALAEAAANYARAHALQPRSNWALGNLVYCLRCMAAWSAMQQPEAELLARLKRGEIGDYATQWIGLDLPGPALRRIATQFMRAQSGLHAQSIARHEFPAACAGATTAHWLRRLGFAQSCD